MNRFRIGLLSLALWSVPCAAYGVIEDPPLENSTARNVVFPPLFERVLMIESDPDVLPVAVLSSLLSNGVLESGLQDAVPEVDRANVVFATSLFEDERRLVLSLRLTPSYAGHLVGIPKHRFGEVYAPGAAPKNDVADEVLRVANDAVVQTLSEQHQRYLQSQVRRIEDLRVSEEGVRDEAKRIQHELEQLRDLGDAILGVETLREQLADVQSELHAVAMNLSLLDPRREAIEMSIADARAEAEGRANSDPVLQELMKAQDRFGQAVESAQASYKAGHASQESVRQSEVGLLEARAAAMTRFERVKEQRFAELAGGIAAELPRLTIEEVSLRSRLPMLKARSEELRRSLEAAQRIDDLSTSLAGVRAHVRTFVEQRRMLEIELRKSQEPTTRRLK